jgi:radical SAM superfamily enzyme YgiQ (UPF0313 family)
MTIVIAAVPYINSDQPVMAPALLKGIAQQHGFESIAIDLNIEVYNLIKDRPNKNKIIEFFDSESVDGEVIDELDEIISYCAERISSYNPKIIALSLLIYRCQIFNKWLTAKLRHLCPDAKIVIGGSGIKSFISDYTDEYYLQCKELGLIDDYIHGNGELAFPEYLKGNLTYPGINSFEQNNFENFNDLPFPNYDDYNFNFYNNPQVPIIDSRGCVKNCEFCDIIEFWQKFQFRSAEKIFSEMLFQIERYGIRNFEFRSSLVNGNMKVFKKLLELISEYNQINSDKQISWAGYFIVRSKNYHNDDLWEMISKTNGTLWLGVESVVPHIRAKMGKPYTNEDLDWHLEASKKYNVPVTLLIIVAYPNETLADYEFTKQWFRDRKQYANSIHNVTLSYAAILPGTQLARNSEMYKIKRHPTLPSVWINQTLNITTKKKIEYHNELVEICSNECKFNLIKFDEAIYHTDMNGHGY